MISNPTAVITDTSGNQASVKPATTPAVAADKALVVAVSPNNSVAVTAASLPLPTGASTFAAQTDGTQRTRVTDGTNNAAVKAASTAPVAADPALVVAISPNSPQTLVDNAAFSDGASRVTPAGFIFDETAGTALTENDVAAARVDSKRALVGAIEDATTRGRRATVKAGSTSPLSTDTALVVGLSPNGNQATEITLQNFSNKFNNGQVTQDSSVGVSIGLNRSFTAVSDFFFPDPNAEDIFYIKSVSSTAYVTRLWISFAGDGTDVTAKVHVIKRSTANDPGTVCNIVAHEEGDSATAEVYYYTAIPTLGAEIGKIWTGYLSAPHDSSPKFGMSSNQYTWEWEAPSTKKPIVLRKTFDEGLSINLNGLVSPDIVVACGVEWYER